MVLWSREEKQIRLKVERQKRLFPSFVSSISIRGFFFLYPSLLFWPNNNENFWEILSSFLQLFCYLTFQYLRFVHTSSSVGFISFSLNLLLLSSTLPPPATACVAAARGWLAAHAVGPLPWWRSSAAPRWLGACTCAPPATPEHRWLSSGVAAAGARRC